MMVYSLENYNKVVTRTEHKVLVLRYFSNHNFFQCNNFVENRVIYHVTKLGAYRH